MIIKATTADSTRVVIDNKLIPIYQLEYTFDFELFHRCMKEQK